MSNYKYKNALLVDDSDIDLLICKTILLNTRFSKYIVEKKSVGSALDYLISTIDKPEDTPDIIFLDIMMPVMDGFVFLNNFDLLPDSIKRHSRIIVLSSTESLEDLNRVNSNKYVYKFLSKPLTKIALSGL